MRVERVRVSIHAVLNSPHGVEVIVRGDVVLVIAGEAQLTTVTLVDKVPEFFGTQGLKEVVLELD